MFKKVLSLALVAAISAGIAIGATIAWFTDTEEAVNVMTTGSVYIEQYEQERDENGNLVDFKQNKPAYPAVGPIEWAENGVNVNGTEYKVFTDELKNVIDKIVTVKNTGKSDAYVRTIVAIEAPDGDPNDLIHVNVNITGVSNTAWTPVVINGVQYVYSVFTYAEALAPGAISVPSLMQVFLDSATTNEDAAKFGDTWEILVLSQAGQVSGFENDDPNVPPTVVADAALDAMFGDPAAQSATDSTKTNAQVWFEDIEIPTFKTYEGVTYAITSTNATVTSTGGDTLYRYVISDGMSTVSDVVIGEGITRLDNRSLCKAPTMKTVSLPDSLTYIDESVFQQSGFVEIEIPENVTYIGKQAFGACADLEKIVINAKNVTICNYVARACANLKEVYINSDSVTFESGSMYFTNKESGDASGITFYVKNQAMADTLYSAFSTSSSYGLLIKSLDGITEYYNTLK